MEPILKIKVKHNRTRVDIYDYYFQDCLKASIKKLMDFHYNKGEPKITFHFVENRSPDFPIPGCHTFYVKIGNWSFDRCLDGFCGLNEFIDHCTNHYIERELS